MTTYDSFTFRSIQLPSDAKLLHSWIATEHARYWGMPTASLDEIETEYRGLLELPDYEVLLGELRGEPRFLVELYDPSTSSLAGKYPYVRGDRGLHFLAPDPAGKGETGFTLHALGAAIRHAFAQPGIERVVVEPDVRNKAIQALNSRVGFQPLKEVTLDEPQGPKAALLSICTREDFERTTGISAGANHLSPARWERANRHVLAKALGEFSHERLLEPLPLGKDRYRVEKQGHRYVFTAQRYALNHWQISQSSVEHLVQGAEGWDGSDVDVLDFVTLFATELTLSEAQLPTYLEELNSTLGSHCYKQAHALHDSTQLAEAAGSPAESFQRIESSMTEGHPCFVANNGRIGVGSLDYLRYAPETGSAIRLGWVAAHISQASFDSIDGLDYQSLLEQELDGEAKAQLDRHLSRRLAGTGLDPAQYIYLPVHPWQWENRLSTTFANDIARGQLIWLGYSADEYQAQQSIRTFFNVTSPSKHYVKTAMSILNMGFMRGLSADYMKVTPAINQWLYELFASDPVLASQPVALLREVAAVGYRNQQFEAATTPSAPQRKMLAALWRESPIDMLGPGETLATMASLLHVDAHGKSYAAALIRRSGLEPKVWLNQYLEAYLAPLVHCLAAYDLVFMPHGENIILVLRDGAVQRVLLKDLGEEIAVLSDRVELPETIRRVRTGGDPVLSIFTDVFDSFFRFLAPLLDAESLLPETEFWQVVTENLLNYREQHPDFADRFEALGLFADSFPLSCLNRLQLRNNQQMLDLSDQSGGLLYAGDLDNPLVRVVSPV
ncbi:GNAT family N-acetyltransferase [Glutamicibacter sp. 287]|uniref:GNAT family N-acetyltransferase n=1 Tax=unclassified Glutamicibacter TaxID=2627139 RepID=UPI000BB7E3F3|nr:GNAT family N-acetyltransferase [Glutamicibacter sp. BW80]PCC27923.1 transcriptional regulator [Glutamicibacter sp. BW80]